MYLVAFTSDFITLIHPSNNEDFTSLSINRFGLTHKWNFVKFSWNVRLVVVLVDCVVSTSCIVIIARLKATIEISTFYNFITAIICEPKLLGVKFRLRLFWQWWLCKIKLLSYNIFLNLRQYWLNFLLRRKRQRHIKLRHDNFLRLIYTHLNIIDNWITEREAFCCNTGI